MFDVSLKKRDGSEFEDQIGFWVRHWFVPCVSLRNPKRNETKPRRREQCSARDLNPKRERERERGQS